MVRARVVLAMTAALVMPRMVAAQFKVDLIDPTKKRPGALVENLDDGVYDALFSTAEMLAEGGSLRSSRTSDGGIVDTYQISPCSLPTTNEAQRQKNKLCLQAIDFKRNAWMKFLRTYADADRSGFVTREETAPIFLGVRLGFHAAQLGVSKPEDLLALIDYRHYTKARMLAELAAYARLRESALQQNLTGMPELPAPLAQAVRTTTPGAPVS
jgi:hypothetical protein